MQGRVGEACILVVVAHALVQVFMICMASCFRIFFMRANVWERSKEASVSRSICRSSAICRLKWREGQVWKVVEKSALYVSAWRLLGGSLAWGGVLVIAL